MNLHIFFFTIIYRSFSQFDAPPGLASAAGAAHTPHPPCYATKGDK